jgi:hypothetical protein
MDRARRSPSPTPGVGFDRPASDVGMDSREIHAGLLRLGDDELGGLKTAGII